MFSWQSNLLLAGSERVDTKVESIIIRVEGLECYCGLCKGYNGDLVLSSIRTTSKVRLRMLVETGTGTMLIFAGVCGHTNDQ